MQPLLLPAAGQPAGMACSPRPRWSAPGCSLAAARNGTVPYSYQSYELYSATLSCFARGNENAASDGCMQARQGARGVRCGCSCVAPFYIKHPSAACWLHAARCSNPA